MMVILDAKKLEFVLNLIEYVMGMTTAVMVVMKKTVVCCNGLHIYNSHYINFNSIALRA